jgi:hypothetical protein
VSEKTPRETPQLGIFWVVQTTDGKAKLLTAGCPLDQAEPYGDCLTYGPGHYETWTQWRRDKAVDPALRAMVGSYEYKGWPRGTKPAEQRSGAKAPETALSTTRLSGARLRRRIARWIDEDFEPSFRPEEDPMSESTTLIAPATAARKTPVEPLFEPVRLGRYDLPTTW